MTMAELYPNLPGFTVEYKDRGLVIPAVPVITDRVVLIGTATDGPAYEPVEIQSPDDYAETIFGKAYTLGVDGAASNGTTLMLGALEAYEAGCRNIALVRVGGTVAVGDCPNTVMTLTSIYPGALYNTVTYMIDLISATKKFCIKTPAVKGAKTITIELGTKTIAQLVDAINNHPDNNCVIAAAVAGQESGVATAVLTNTPPHATLTTTWAGAGQVKLTSVASPGTDVTITFADTDQATTSVTVAGSAITVDLETATSTIVATVQEVVDAINADVEANLLVTAELVGTGSALAEADTVQTLVNTPAYAAMTGGTDGPSTADLATYKTAMYQNLYLAYGMLEDYDFDIVVPLGVYADYEKVIGSYTTTFGEQLANFCADTTGRNNEVFGVIGMTPTTSITQMGIKAQVAALAAKDNFYYKITFTAEESGGTWTFSAGARVKDVDSGADKSVGHFINVVAMPEGGFKHPVLGNYYAPITAAYAGLISSLSAESATTNKVIPNVKRLRYRLSPAQLDTLTGKRYVTFKVSNQNVAVVDGCTACEVTYDSHGNLSFRSDYWRLSTLRVVFKAVSEVRKAAEPFIGEPNETAQQNALDTAIKSALNKLKPKALIDFRFSINATLQQKILGESYITLELVPALERRKIKVSVSLRAS